MVQCMREVKQEKDERHQIRNSNNNPEQAGDFDVRCMGSSGGDIVVEFSESVEVPLRASVACAHTAA